MIQKLPVMLSNVYEMEITENSLGGKCISGNCLLGAL